MDAIFAKLLEISIYGSVMPALILLLRGIFRGISRRVLFLLWAVAAARLTLPFSFETEFRVLTAPKQHIPEAVNRAAAFESGVSAMHIAAAVWLCGAAVCVMYMLFSILLLKKQTRECAADTSGVLLCDRIPAPFVLGIVNPRIFLPSDIAQEDKRYVLLHEQGHIARHDNIWKPLGFLVVCAHWFNPLVWVAFWAFSQDIEIACDSLVTRTMSTKDRKRYATALLNCSAKSRMLSACPVAFSETSVKQRIKRVLANKKAPVIVTVVVAVLVPGMAVYLFTAPKSAAVNTQPSSVKQTNVAVAQPASEATQPPPQTPSKPTAQAPAKPPAEPATAEEQEAAYADEPENYGNYESYDASGSEENGSYASGFAALEEYDFDGQTEKLYQEHYDDLRKTVLEVEQARSLHENDKSDDNEQFRVAWDITP